MIRNRTLAAMLAGATLAFASPALAIDGDDLLTKLNAAYDAAAGVTIGYSGVSVSGDTVTVDGVEVRTTGMRQPARVGRITFDGVEEDGSGGYTVETVSFPNINQSRDGVTVVANDLELTGLVIPAAVQAGTIESLLIYDTASTGAITVTNRGRQVFATSGMEANIDRLAGDTGLAFDATLSDIEADLSQIKDPKARDAIGKLGLERLSGRITMKGSWELASGLITLEEQAFDFNDVGRLNLSLAISGYTLDFLKSMQDALKTVESNANQEEARQALGLSMMGLLQQLTFNSASITFEDDTLTRKLLDFAGSQQGVSGEQMAQALKGLAPIMIAQLNMPELQNQLSQAISTYLDDPRSLTITARPQNPVPFPMILGAAMGAPNTIPQVLGVTVSANDGP